MTLFAILASVLFSVQVASAQLWSGILDPSRAADWTVTGVTGGIPTNRTQCGATIAAYSGTAATINAAIAACGANQYVLLGAGTFTLTTGIEFAPTYKGTAASNVTLRGSGPDQTQLVFTAVTGSSCNTPICLMDSTQMFGTCTVGPGHGHNPNTATWTAGYSQGTTSITIDNITGNSLKVSPPGDPNPDAYSTLAAGSIIHLDQLDDDVSIATSYRPFVTQTAPYALFVGNQTRPSRLLGEAHKVVSISGSGPYTVTITPALAYPYFSGSQSPGVWWCGSPGQTPTYDGIENLTINNQTGLTNMQGLIKFVGAQDSWVKNVRQIQGSTAQVWIENSVNVEVRDSYFYKGLTTADTNYGLTPVNASFVRIENNIIHQQNVAIITQPCAVCVIGYNYIVGTNSPTGQPSTGLYNGLAGAVNQVFMGRQ
jgi:hypothetical protein